MIPSKFYLAISMFRILYSLSLKGGTSTLSFPLMRESSVSISATGGSAYGMRIILDSRSGRE